MSYQGLAPRRRSQSLSDSVIPRALSTQKENNNTLLVESSVKRPYQQTAATDFLRRISEMSEEEKKQVLSQPQVLDLLVTSETINALESPALHKLLDVVDNVLTDDQIDEILADFPNGDAPVGNFDMVVKMGGIHLDNFRRKQSLTDVAIRGTLASQQMPIPPNFFLASEEELSKKRVEPFPRSVDTLLFPLRMDVADGHWVLVVVELHLRPLGNMYRFSVYNSNKLSRYMSSLGQLAIEPVLEHLSGILPKSEWKFSRKEVKCAAHEKIEDSGIAVISNAIAILNHSTLEEDMGEVACWTRREKYARHCMESANTNMRILQRADAILTVMEGNTESLASRKRVTIGDLCAIHMSSQEAFGQNYVW